MAADLTLPVQEAVVAHLRMNVALTSLIPAGRIYGQEVLPNSPYPFVRFGEPVLSPLDYSCQNGCMVTVDVHAFAENEDEAKAIGRELVTALEGVRLALEGGYEAEVRWIGGPTLRDPEDERLWHAVRTFELEAG